MLTVLVFVVQLYLFGAISLYLHYLSEHYGYSPILFFVAGIMGVFNIIELIPLSVEPAANIAIRLGGHVYVPIILLIILVLYVTGGTRTARITIAGLIGIDILILVVLFFLLLYTNLREPATIVHGVPAQSIVLTPSFLRGVLASVFTFTANMFVIIIVYQGVRNAFPAVPESLVPGFALLIALWVDAVLYNILAFMGTSLFASGVPSDILVKTLAGILLAPLAGWYLTRVAPNLTRYVGAANRSTFSILFGEGETDVRLVQLENELQVSRATYEQIVHNIGEIFWLVDIERKRLLYLSPSFEALTGKAPEGFYRNPRMLLGLLHPEDRTGDMIEKVLLSPETEFRVQREDGEVRWMRNRSFPIVTQDQQIVRYAGIAEDITLRREAQAQAFALELSREKVNLLHRFVRDASHDLKTPLSAILLKVDLMNVADASRRKDLQRELRAAAKHLSDLIDNLFTLSRIESDEQIAQSSVDFNEIVQAVVDNSLIIAQNKGLNLVLHLADATLPIMGNRDQLLRLAANLIENAIHYTERGTIAVNTLTNGHQVVLEVADTGIGIPEAHLQHIFERFYRVEQARSMRREGTGLGMAICKAIVEQHRGTITVESREGQGTTFRAVFPIDNAGRNDTPRAS